MGIYHFFGCSFITKDSLARIHPLPNLRPRYQHGLERPQKITSSSSTQKTTLSGFRDFSFCPVNASACGWRKIGYSINFELVGKLMGALGDLFGALYFTERLYKMWGYPGSLIYNKYKLLSGLPYLALLNEKTLKKKRYNTLPAVFTVVLFCRLNAPVWTAFLISSGAS